MCATGAVSTRSRRATRSAKIYGLLRARTGHDFSEYKDRTFMRRVQRRMQVRAD